MSVVEYNLTRLKNGWLVVAVEENPEDPGQIAKTAWFEQTLSDAFQTLQPPVRTPAPAILKKPTTKPIPYSPEDPEAM